MWVIVLAEASTGATIVGISALVTATGGAMSAYASMKAARREASSKAEAECLERLKEVRAESETLAEQLHAERIKKT